jgi:hypothetical protein
MGGRNYFICTVTSNLNQTHQKVVSLNNSVGNISEAFPALTLSTDTTLLHHKQRSSASCRQHKEYTATQTEPQHAITSHCKLPTSGIHHHVVCIWTNIWEENITSSHVLPRWFLARLIFNREEGCETFLRNVHMVTTQHYMPEDYKFT